MVEQVDLSYYLAHPDICQKEASALQRSIAWETMTSRGLKGFTQYGFYFACMWVYGLVEPVSARIIRSGNFYWRWVDDVADKDRPLPEGYPTITDFLQRKGKLIDSLFSNQAEIGFGDKIDILLVSYSLDSKKQGFSLKDESRDILDTLVWDEERARNRKVLTQAKLDEGLGQLDLACVDGAFKVAKEPYTSKDLESLSWAMRTMFNLRDFPKDFSRGIINISLEDIEQYGVDLTELKGRDSVEQLLKYDPMKDWYGDQINMGLEFLEQSRQQVVKMRLRRITRLALGLNFFWPADKTLNKYAKMLAL